MPITDLLPLAAFFFLFLVLIGFVSYNRSRIRQMLYHLGLCRGNELTEREYVDLLGEYTSFLGYASFSPSRRHYPRLYTNPAFAAFAQRSKRIMIYYAVALVAGLLANALL
jgi:hypothetical protein